MLNLAGNRKHYLDTLYNNLGIDYLVKGQFCQEISCQSVNFNEGDFGKKVRTGGESNCNFGIIFLPLFPRRLRPGGTFFLFPELHFTTAFPAILKGKNRTFMSQIFILSFPATRTI
jgi:hypothetical protein